VEHQLGVHLPRQELERMDMLNVRLLLNQRSLVTLSSTNFRKSGHGRRMRLEIRAAVTVALKGQSVKVGLAWKQQPFLTNQLRRVRTTLKNRVMCDGSLTAKVAGKIIVVGSRGSCPITTLPTT